MISVTFYKRGIDGRALLDYINDYLTGNLTTFSYDNSGILTTSFTKNKDGIAITSETYKRSIDGSAVLSEKKDLLLDGSVLSDARIIDLAGSGVVDNHLVIPRFLIKELYAQAELSDENTRIKAKRALDVAKKLEAIPELELRYNDTDFPDIKDPMNKLLRLGRLIDANILTADISRVQIATIEGVRIINIHSLSNSLKPLMQAGEQIRIKIQRYGKEPRQGIGYLEDGTMVVVNGGGQFIGETIDAQVLSVKHTSSGRMVFCNAADAEGRYPNPYHDEHEEQ